MSSEAILLFLMLNLNIFHTNCSDILNMNLIAEIMNMTFRMVEHWLVCYKSKKFCLHIQIINWQGPKEMICTNDEAKIRRIIAI